MQAQQVRILLVSPPPAKRRPHIAAFLAKLYPQRSAEAIETVLSRSSVALSPWLDESRASRMLEALERLGATVMLDYNITQTIPQAPEAPRKRVRARRRWLAATLVVVLTSAAIATWLLREDGVPHQAPSDYFSDPVVDQGVGPYNDWQGFTAAYALHYDKRIAQGLCMALVWQPTPQGDTPVCRYRETQLDGHSYRLDFRVTTGITPQTIELVLHNTPDSVAGDVERAYQVVQQSLPAAVAAAPGAEVQLHVDSGALLVQAIELERQVLGGEAPRSAMAQVSQIYSWLVFLGAVDLDQRAADRLAGAAIAALLVSGADQDDPWQDRFSSALLMLALGYPRAARTVLGTIQKQSSQQSLALLAYLDKNVALLRQLQSDTDPLPGYLLARALEQSKLDRAAKHQYERLLELNPQSKAVLSLVLRHGSPNQQALYANHLVSTVVGDQIRAVDALDASFASTLLSALSWFSEDFSPEADFAAALIERQERYLLDSAAIDTGSRLLPGGELRELFRNQLQNVLYTTARVAGDVHAAQARSVAPTIYPRDPLVASLQVDTYGDGLEQQLAPFSRSVSEHRLTSAAAVAGLLDGVAHRSRHDERLWPARFGLLRGLRRTLNPSVTGCTLWLRQLRAQGLDPLLADYFDACRKGDPRNVDLYEAIAAVDDDGRYVRLGGRHLGRNYGYLITYARWLARHRPDEAKRFYRQAMSNDPAQPDAYRELGTLLAAQGRGDAAVAIWREYLKQDDKTPVSFEMRARIAGQLLAQGQLDRAYAVAQQLSGTTDPFALAVAARVAAAADEPATALAQLQRAARVDPTGQAPAQLAAYQWHTGDLPGATQTLRANRASNPPYYYLPTFTDHIDSAGDLQQVLSVVRDVESDQPLLTVQLRLARALAGQRRYRNAARLLQKPAFDLQGSPAALVPVAGAEYVDYRLRAGTTPSPAVRLIGDYGKAAPASLGELGIELLGRGLAVDAYRAFATSYGRDARHNGETLVLMASAWQLGRRSSSVKRQLRARAERDGHDTWTRMRVGFLVDWVAPDRVAGVANTATRRCEVFYLMAIKAMAAKAPGDAYRFALLSLATDQRDNTAFRLAHDLVTRSLRGQEE